MTSHKGARWHSLANHAGRLTFVLILVFAVAPPAFAALYSPGQTLDPACAPTDPGCGISTIVASSTANSIPYYAANGSALSATSTITILQNDNVGIGTTSPFTMLSVAGNGYFSGSVNVGDATTTRSNLGLAYASVSQINDNLGETDIAAWGDSITAGATSPSYPSVLSSISGYYVYNGGVSGQTSTQIAAHMLANPSMFSWPTIIWAGYNNYTATTTVEADIATMAAALTSDHYIILSILNSPAQPSGSAGYNDIIQINNYLAATYGSHYLNVREYLVQDGLAAAGLTPTTQDLINISEDVPPDSLEFGGGVHLNGTGNTVVADYIYQQNFTLLTSTAASNALLTAGSVALMLNPRNGYELNGFSVLNASSTNFSTMVGQYAGAALSSNSTLNTAVGYSALSIASSTANSNTAVGAYALTSNTTGSNNTAIGKWALYYNSTGSSNAALGSGAMNVNTTGSSNIGIGGLGGNTTGSYNIGIGPAALGVGNGTGNNAVGTYALYVNTTGSYNIALGYKAGLGDQTNVNNASYIDNDMVFIGTNASRDASVATSTALTDGIAIGDNAHVFTSYEAVLGDASINTTLLNGNVGIGTTTPGDLLTVGGPSIIVSGSLTPNLAGTYVYMGTYDGKNYYESAAGYIWWSGAYWFIAPSLGVQTNDFYYTSSNPVPPSLSSGWSAQNGASGSLTTSAGSGTYFTADYNGNIVTGGRLTVSGNGVSSIVGNLGIGTTSPYAPLEIWGPNTASTSAFLVSNSASTTVFDVYDNGNATYSGSIFQSSDQRLKTDITPLDATSSLAEIEGLTPVSYLRIDQPDQGTNLGFIAQAVQQIFPELVSPTSATALTPDGTLTLNYEGLIAPLVSAVQSLATEISGFAQSITTAVLNATDINGTNITATQQLCVGGTCITGVQLQELMQNAGQSSASQAASPIVITNVTAASSTDSTASTTIDTNADSSGSSATTTDDSTDASATSTDPSSTSDTISPADTAASTTSSD